MNDIPNYNEFKSRLIRSVQDGNNAISSNKVEECRRILDSPTGELIIRAALLATSMQ